MCPGSRKLSAICAALACQVIGGSGQRTNAVVVVFGHVRQLGHRFLGGDPDESEVLGAPCRRRHMPHGPGSACRATAPGSRCRCRRRRTGSRGRRNAAGRPPPSPALNGAIRCGHASRRAVSAPPRRATHQRSPRSSHGQRAVVGEFLDRGRPDASTGAASDGCCRTRSRHPPAVVSFSIGRCRGGRRRPG